MKTNLTILAYLLFSFTVTAQILPEEIQSLQQNQYYKMYTESVHNSQNSLQNSTPTQRLDSIVQKNYDYYNNLYNYSLTVLGYDGNFNRNVKKLYHWLNNSWHPTEEIYEVYNVNNVITESTYHRQYNDYVNDFDHRDKWIYTYTNNLLTDVLLKRKYYQAQNYSDIERVKYEYSNGKLDKITTTRKFNGQWDFSQKWENSYNSSNELIEIVRYFYDNGSWDPEKKESYQYQNGLEVEMIQSFYNNATNNWDIDRGIRRSYTTANLLDTLEVSVMENNVWELCTVYDYNYDSLLNLSTSFIHKNLCLSGTAGIEKTEYVYDNNYPHAELISPYDMEFFRHKMLTGNNELYNSGQWYQDDIDIYYWTTVIPNNSESVLSGSQGVTTYPNPASNSLHFELPKSTEPATVELYNAAGQRVISQQLSDNTLQLKDLPTGFYSYLVHQDGKAYSGKVIIE